MCILLFLYFLADEVDNSQFSVNKVNLHQIQADLTFSQQKRGLQTSNDEIKSQKSTTRSGFNFLFRPHKWMDISITFLTHFMNGP